MKESQYIWREQKGSDDANQLVSELEKLNQPKELAPFLWNRNIQKSEELRSFFQPSVEDFHDPYLMYDMEKVIDRIQRAVEAGERILVYGDYDADGITSTTVMKEAIELIGGDVTYYLPNRFNDGYGPNLEVYKRFIEEGIELIVTVDNGVSGHEAITYAMSQGIDVIVTDHHELPEELPNAFAIVHPRHPKGEYPFNDLAGVGVAFKVATALLGEIPIESLDLVAIGTIADLVSLTGENRSLVKIGLEMMKQTERIGLQMLASVAQVDLRDATEETIGFTLGPRLNAIGRLGDASPGVELLSTFDEEEASRLASFIQEKNSERQLIVKKATEEALVMAEEQTQEPILFLISKEWHEGVLGIVASQVVSKVGKPVIVLTYDETTNRLKGSGRSIQGIDLFKTLSQVKSELISFGGHHMAAGLTFDYDKLETIKQSLANYLEVSGLLVNTKEELIIDSQLSIEDISVEYIDMFKRLAPFGTDNPSPYFLIQSEEIAQLKQIGADNTHLKCQLRNDKASLDCIAFNRGSEIAEFTQGEAIRFVGQLSINEWNGLRKPQLMLTDYEVDGFQLFDIRGKKSVDTKPTSDKVAYLIFNDESLPIVETKPEQDVFVASLLDEEKYLELNQYEEVVIVDCPYELGQAKEIFSKLTIKRLFFFVQVKEEHYLTGLPSREQFGKLFKFIATFPSLDVRYKLGDMANYLKIEKKLLIFMINVFFDLGFVTIENGLMARVEKPESKPLQESKVYQEYQQKIEMEKLFLYSDIKEIKQWILQQEEV
ncbi:MAG: single-stranded-DNA-specific exonuclease RecJ [Vagococcus sp.]